MSVTENPEIEQNKKNPGLFDIIQLLVLRSRKDRLLLLGSLAIVAATSIFSAIMPLIFATAVDSLLPGAKNAEWGVILAVVFGLSIGIVGIIESMQWLTYGALSVRLNRNLIIYSMSHVVQLPFYRLKTLSTYEVGRSVEKGLDAIRNTLTSLVLFLVPGGVELVVSTVVMAVVIDVYSATIFFVAVVVYAWLAKTAAQKVRSATESAMQLGQGAWGFGMDGVANAELLQQSAIVPAYSDRLRKKLETADVEWVRTFHHRAVYGAAQAIVFCAAVTFVLWRGAVDVVNGGLSIGDLVLINAYILRLISPVELFAKVYGDFQASMGEARLLKELLEMDSARPSAAQISPIVAAPTLMMKGGYINLDGQRKLGPLNFSIPAGGKLFVVGPSGAGKSSLLRIVSCLVPLETGDYGIDGNSVDEGSMSAFRPMIAVSQQSSLMFNQSLMDNVTLGLDVSEDQAREVLVKLGLSDLLQREASGDWTLGEQGGRLSGGERQRISLARAILKKPKLLLLDEPTASLDPNNREIVNGMINSIGREATIVHVTHEVSKLKNTDMVLFLGSDGSTLFGTHKNLVKSSPVYVDFLASPEALHEV